ncbi:beta-ketoacyl-[acyl-carrier-protein] synthase family protein [Planctomicrobium sp. SH664]|uniref:beta-ketoacyl-[acyl-carrier-protein] synthase family protein n=1 Tax=Planctomicrobium sp. SH664 TaxID=3448125 RepID=UPI003F5BF73B
MSADQNQRRIVITGLGIFSPIGVGREAFWKRLAAGESGIVKTASSQNPAPPGHVGGEVVEFTEESAKKDYLKSQRKSIKVMCREVQLGAAAALQALDDSGLDLSALQHDRVGVEYGANLMLFSPESLADPCGVCRNESGEFQITKWGDAGIGAMEPLWMLRYLPNMPACHIAIFTDARGPNNSVTLDEASPGVALTEAFNIMKRGAADVMLVGGTGTRIHSVRAIHARLYDDLAYDEENPTASCKPFDQRRSGQVLSEGAACLVLEEEAHAKARGAKILGTLLGGGSSCVAAPDGTADVKQAVLNSARSALRRAGLQASDLGHINAHGIATAEGDRAEAEAIRILTEGANVPVTGLKGYFGNAGASTGFFEIIASLLSLQQGEIPRTLNCRTPDGSLKLNLVGDQTVPTSNKRFLSVNFTRAGQASAVVLEGV